MDEKLRRKRLLEAARPSQRMLDTTGWMDMAEMGINKLDEVPKAAKKSSKFGKILSRLGGRTLGTAASVVPDSMDEPEDDLERRLERGDRLSEAEMMELKDRADMNSRMMSNPFRDNDPANREERVKRRMKATRMLAGEYDE